jgi:hypothetical protein
MIKNGVEQDRKSFSIFLMLNILTALNFIFFTSSPVAFGLVAVVWGMFGFFRLVYLTHYQMEDVPKMLNLPIQILFGTGQKEQEKRKLTIKRMARPDVILWLGSAIFFMFWALFNSFYPSTIDMDNISTTLLKMEVDPYAILTKISYLGVLVTLVFVSLTYSQKRTHFKWAFLILVPIALIGLFNIMQGYYVASTLWLDINHLRGLGLSQTIVSESSLINRFLALGSIGAYGVYVLGAPAAFMLIKAFISPNRSYFKPFLGILSLMLLALIDILVISSIWTSFTFVLLICLATLSWGHTVRYKL